MIKSKQLKDSLILYFRIIIIILGILFIWLNCTHLTFVRNGDAVTQHYPAFLYIGRYWRGTITEFFHGGYAPKMWDFSIGFGADIYQTLTYYSLFDWSTVIFAIFSNAKNGAVLYTAMMLFRTFISGIAFIVFCYKMNCTSRGSVLATFAYILCPYMLDNVFNGHHFFGLAFLYLPLILIGLERILDNEIDLLYPVVIALSITGQYYFFYMEMVFATLWFLCRYFDKNKFELNGFLKFGFRYVGLTCIGVLISMPIILPQILALMSDFRSNGKMTVHLFYPISAYEKVLGNLITSDTFSTYSYVGISPCILLGVISLFCNSEHRYFKIIWLITFVSTLFPITGYAMNGFSYVTNRHSWLLAFISCFIFAAEYEHIIERFGVRPFIGVALYSFLVLLLWQYAPDKKELTCALGILIVCSVLLLISRRGGGRYSHIILIACTVVGIALHIHSIFGEDGGALKFFTKSEVEKKYFNDYEMAFSEVGEDRSLWRMNFLDFDRRPNTLNNIYGEGSTYTYWSFQNSNLVRYMMLNGLVYDSPSELHGLNNRVVLGALNAAKYFLMDNMVYKNMNALPISYYYDLALNEDAYEKASYAEKEYFQMLSCITTEENVLNSFDSDKNMRDSLSFDLEYSGVSGKQIIVENTRKPFKIDVNVPGNGILYLEIKNLHYSHEGDYSYVTLMARSEDSAASWIHLTPEHVYYFGNRDYLLDLGYSENARSEINLYLSRVGTYSFDDLRIEFIPYELIRDGLTARSQRIPQNIQTAKNSLSMTTNTNREEILYISIPFSSGWNLYIDGTKNAIFRANVMGIGSIIPPGEHCVELTYCTPGLKIGLVLGVFGYTILIIIAEYRRKRRKQTK